MNLLFILAGQIKARACDWVVEGKCVAGGFREEEERKEERRWGDGGDGGRCRKRWKEDGAEPRGLEKPQAARDLPAGDRVVQW